jgi:hypothetical protein
MLAGACQSDAVPAVVSRADAGAMNQLKAALARAMGRASVELGPGDPAQSPVISVLPLPPGPLEDRSLAKPTIFHLEIAGGACTLVRQDTGERFPAEGVDCRAVGR